MDISPFAFFMALLWSGLFITLFHSCRRNNLFITKVGIFVLFFLIAVSAFRMLFTIELPFTFVVRSPFFLTNLQDFLNTEFVLDLAVVHFLLGSWATIALILLVDYVKVMYKNIHSLKTVYYKIDVESQKILEQIADGSKCKKIPTSIRCSDIAGPFIFDYAKPMIYLPDYDYSEQDLYNVLLHEWVHFYHRDAWIKILVQLFCIVFWWNPLVYIMQADVMQILEMNCDRTAAKILKKNNRKVTSYTETIINMVRQQKTVKKKVSISTFLSKMFYTEKQGEEDLKQRFIILLRSEKTEVDKRAVALFVTAVLSLFAFSFTFVIQPENPAPVVEGAVDVSEVYLQLEENGNYSLYIDGIYQGLLTPDKAMPLIESGITIKNGENKT